MRSVLLASALLFGQTPVQPGTCPAGQIERTTKTYPVTMSCPAVMCLPVVECGPVANGRQQCTEIPVSCNNECTPDNLFETTCVDPEKAQ